MPCIRPQRLVKKTNTQFYHHGRIKPLYSMEIIANKSHKEKCWEELMAYFPWYDTYRTENESPTILLLLHVFVAAVTFLPSRYGTTIRGFLSSRCLATSGGGNYEAMMERNYQRKPKLTEKKNQLHLIHHKFHMKEFDSEPEARC
jgi:hypothetical protein